MAILGATGAVGQTFIRLLAGHPWFQVAEVAASDRSAGKRYADATRWIEGEMPAEVAGLTVTACDPGAVSSPIVFSALDSDVAGEVEGAFAAAGRLVLSNAKNYRMDPDVPLVIPEVNAEHLALLDTQRAAARLDGRHRDQRQLRGHHGGHGAGAAARRVRCAPRLRGHDAGGERRGLSGVPSLDILGNVIPYIGDEEPKLEREMQKMLGHVESGAVVNAPFVVSAHANRVAVENGHTVCLSVEFEHAPSVEAASKVLRVWRGASVVRGLPSAPPEPLHFFESDDRPQPRRDALRGRGMTVSVGRLRTDPLFHLKFVAMGHNTIRGAAGGSILNAELLVATGRAGVT